MADGVSSKKIKAPNNRTLDTDVKEGKKYLKQCLKPGRKQLTAEEIRDRVILGDSFKVMGKLPKESFDLIIADPPYNLTKNFGGKIFGKRSRDEYEKFTEKWLVPALELLKPTGSMYVCCDWKSSMIIGGILAEHAYVRNRITWQREKGRGAARNWKNGLEDIYFVTKSEDYTFNLEAVKIRRRVMAPYRENGVPKDWQEAENGKGFRDTCPSNFWDDITVPFWSMPENTPHPTQKPEKLIAKLILASSNEGDTVFDPFLGSGTTAVAAKKLGRHFVGIEESEQYCIFSQMRLERAERDKEIQGFSDGVFWERNSKPGGKCR